MGLTSRLFRLLLPAGAVILVGRDAAALGVDADQDNVGPIFGVHRAPLVTSGGWQSQVYCTGLENRRPREGPGGSNPPPPAISIPAAHHQDCSRTGS